MRQLGARLPEPTPETNPQTNPPSEPAKPPVPKLAEHALRNATEAHPESRSPDAQEVLAAEARPRGLAVDSPSSDRQAAAPPDRAGTVPSAPEPPRVESRWAEMRTEHPDSRPDHRPDHLDLSNLSNLDLSRLSRRGAAVPARGNAQPEPRQAFEDVPHPASGRSGRIEIEEVPRQEGAPWGLLAPTGATREEEEPRRFPFLTVAIPSLAALLALGALLWSGALRDRVHQQDAAMNALQEQNRKLADTVAEMDVEHKATNALQSGGDTANTPAPPRSQQKASPALRSATAPAADQPAAPAASATPSPQTAPPAAKATAPAAPPARTGESTPPPVRETQDKAGEQAAERAPEIVPPYPTILKPKAGVTQAGANQTSTGQQAGSSGAASYHEPFPIGQSAATATAAPSAGTHSAPVQTAHSAPPAAVSSPSSPLSAPPAAAPQSYYAAGNGQYASPLAQNIETVEGLQRHSTVPLQEFHVHDGMLTKVTPSLGLSVRHPDAGHGTFTLMVNEGGGGYQVRGQVNNPLVFTDNSTHVAYELVVLKIADGQVYGYVRSMH